MCHGKVWFLFCSLAKRFWHISELALSEAKRTFLPIKFYLINAVRICSEHSCQDMIVFGEIVKCLLLVSSFCVFGVVNMRAASEALVDVVEPTSNLLLHSILNSPDVELESKMHILDCLFTDKNDACTFSDIVVLSPKSSFSGVPAHECDILSKTGTLTLGRIMLLLNLLKCSVTLKDVVVFGLSKKLGYLLHCFMNEDVYTLILTLHIPVLHSTTTNSGIAWEPMLPFILHALKTFMVVASSSSSVWQEMEDFLFQNLFHPHRFCLEIVVELWCFFIQHAETETVNEIFDKLCSLIKMMSSSEDLMNPLSALRKVARSMCSVLTHATQATVDHVYSSVQNDDGSNASTIVSTALLMEGFPLNSLSDNLKKHCTQRYTIAFYNFIAKYMELGSPISSWSGDSLLHGLSVQALSSALQNMQIADYEGNATNVSQVLAFTASVIQKLKEDAGASKACHSMLLGASLNIIANMTNLYALDEIRNVIQELRALFVGGSSPADAQLYQCKPMLASFLAGLSCLEMVESDEDTLSLAVWDLYHMLLRERHWAFSHLALLAFGSFAAQTSCNELWRFVPGDAALSFDVETGKEANTERFMSELKAFFEKGVALNAVDPCKDQLLNLTKEGILLKRKAREELDARRVLSVQEENENCDGNQAVNKKKRKLPEEISVGISLLRNGLKVLKEGLSATDYVDINEDLAGHLSRLEDVVIHFVGLL